MKFSVLTLCGFMLFYNYCQATDSNNPGRAAYIGLSLSSHLIPKTNRYLETKFQVELTQKNKLFLDLALNFQNGDRKRLSMPYEYSKTYGYYYNVGYIRKLNISKRFSVDLGVGFLNNKFDHYTITKDNITTVNAYTQKGYMIHFTPSINFLIGKRFIASLGHRLPISYKYEIEFLDVPSYDRYKDQTYLYPLEIFSKKSIGHFVQISFLYKLPYSTQKKSN
ncbi:MAG TPA: hypothetical protein VGF79_00120 [Bacteroidia bacterium]